MQAGTLFPLTPALSLGEREDSRPRWKRLSGPWLIPNGRKCFPLPGGEGQGEGRQRLQHLDTTKDKYA